MIGHRLTQRQHGSNGMTVAPGLRSTERAGVVVTRLVRRQRGHDLTNAVIV